MPGDLKVRGNRMGLTHQCREEALSAFLQAAREVLESGDDEGCSGLVVVTESSYRRLREAVHALTGEYHGIGTRAGEGPGGDDCPDCGGLLAPALACGRPTVMCPGCGWSPG